jgi:hypothetical protein
MKRLISAVAIVALFTSGAVHAQSPAAGFTRSNDYWLTYAEKLPIGATVVVRTADGRRMTAILAIVDDTGITLERKTRIPEPPARVPFSELRQLELKQNGSNIGRAVAIGVGVGASTFFGIMLIMLAAYSD